MLSVRARLLLLSALLLPTGALAFSVPDHGALTREALEAALEQGEHPQLAAHRAAVVEGSQAEDLNLHVKWTGWHHFLHPGTTLDSPFRRDSAARVHALWEEAEEAASHGDLRRAFDRVGHLVHHIQDMAVPQHVVPVMHGLSDRFEQHGVGPALKRNPRREVALQSGQEAQLALARETLELVRTGTLAAEGGAVPWSAFWAEPSQPGTFGGYGEAGNAFGLTQVRWKGRRWKVERAEYEAFLDARVEAAVAYSRAFLVWAAQHLTSLADTRAHTLRPRWSPSPELTLELLGGLTPSPQGTAPVAGVRALLPLPGSMKLSLGYLRPLEDATAGGGRWSLALVTPPLLAARPGYDWGLDVRATVGAGLHSQDRVLTPALPVGLRAQALLFGDRFSLSAEAQYQLLSPATAPWARGATFTLGAGFTWGDD